MAAKPGAHSTPPYQKPETVNNSNTAQRPLGGTKVNTSPAGRDIAAEFMAKKHPTGHSRKC